MSELRTSIWEGNSRRLASRQTAPGKSLWQHAPAQEAVKRLPAAEPQRHRLPETRLNIGPNQPIGLVGPIREASLHHRG